MLSFWVVSYKIVRTSLLVNFILSYNHNTNKEDDYMKQQIEVFDYVKEIMGALRKGVLLTTKTHEKVNSMVIS